MNTETVLSGDKLKQIGNASHTAEVVIMDCALRERLRTFSDIQRTKNRLIRDGEKIIEEDYKKFWSDLAAAGVGAIVYGRRGKPDRFEWHYSMKKVAEAAMEGKDIKAFKISEPTRKVAMPAKPIAKVAKAPTKQAPKVIVRRAATKQAPTPSLAVKATPTPAKATALREIFIPIRKDVYVTFSVPSDLSKDEAEAIANTVKRLSA